MLFKEIFVKLELLYAPSPKVERVNLRQYFVCYIIQMCSGITRGGVHNGELYAQRFQKLINVDRLTSEILVLHLLYQFLCTVSN